MDAARATVPPRDGAVVVVELEDRSFPVPVDDGKKSKLDDVSGDEGRTSVAVVPVFPVPKPEVVLRFLESKKKRILIKIMCCSEHSLVLPFNERCTGRWALPLPLRLFIFLGWTSGDAFAEEGASLKVCMTL